MKIIIAKDAGYCFGVRDAVDLAYDIAASEGNVFMLGDIVHNEKVVEDLNNAGSKVVNDLDDIPNGSSVLFRAHGTKSDIWSKAKNKNIKIVDATCPLVHEIHKEVKSISRDGRQIIVIGDHNHDEVVAIADQVPGTIVISNRDEANKLKKYKKAGVVSQSTQTIENVQEIINILMTKVFDLHFVNTICYPTKRNQEQIKELAKVCDLMIIIGSFTSANSKRLTLLSKNLNNNTYQVTCGNDLKKIWFKDMQTIGVSAGASTPDYLIMEVKQKIEEIGRIV
tara:strand:- start:1130 stop:1972 length:843 start_codon:yes stop_codon:yes gene_type:complete